MRPALMIFGIMGVTLLAAFIGSTLSTLLYSIVAAGVVVNAVLVALLIWAPRRIEPLRRWLRARVPTEEK